MIVVAGSIPINPEKQEEAKANLKTMMDATHQEEGCITYQFLFNPWNAGEVHVFEEWETQEALDAHGKSEHMAAFRKELPNFVTGSGNIKRYVVSEFNSL